MNAEEIVQIENEIFTTLVIEELTNQRNQGKSKGQFLLDRAQIEEITKDRLRRYLRGEKSVLKNSLNP